MRSRIAFKVLNNTSCKHTTRTLIKALKRYFKGVQYRRKWLEKLATNTREAQDAEVK